MYESTLKHPNKHILNCCKSAECLTTTFQNKVQTYVLHIG